MVEARSSQIGELSCGAERHLSDIDVHLDLAIPKISRSRLASSTMRCG